MPTLPGSRGQRRILMGLALLLVAGAAMGTRFATLDDDPPAEEVVLRRQNQELESLIAAAQGGRLLKWDEVLIVVDQHLVQDLVSAVAPLEGDVGGGFHVRIESAEAAFGDGLALLRLHGRASIVGRPASAAMSVYGGLDVVGLDPRTGLLRCSVQVFGVDTSAADVLGIDRPARRLTEALAAGGLARLLPSVDVPVRIEDRIALPAVETRRLRIEAAEVPLHAAVSRVAVFGGKLWVSLGLGLQQ